MTQAKTNLQSLTSNLQFDVEQSLHMYQQMAKIRAFEEQVNDLYKGAKMPGLAHLYTGEEAVAVGVCEALRRDDRASEEARYLMHLIYPEKHLQERFYSILPFLARHGTGLLDTIYDNVRLDCPDHKLLVV